MTGPDASKEFQVRTSRAKAFVQGDTTTPTPAEVATAPANAVAVAQEPTLDGVSVAEHESSSTRLATPPYEPKPRKEHTKDNNFTLKMKADLANKVETAFRLRDPTVFTSRQDMLQRMLDKALDEYITWRSSQGHR